jgi:hypothetical protein
LKMGSITTTLGRCMAPEGIIIVRDSNSWLSYV